MRLVNIYTDGACSKNGTPKASGGWAAILLDMSSGIEKEIAGKLQGSRQTNQRAEVTAVIEAMSLIKYPCTIIVYTDSMYVVGTMKNGWKINYNQDLWRTLNIIIEMKKLEVVWVHLKGHNGHSRQERCDRLAVQQTKEQL